MIIHRLWITEKCGDSKRFHPKTQTWKREGWFLFGVLPLYIRTLDYSETR